LDLSGHKTNKGKPQESMGFIPKETIVKTINNILLIK
jgi:hypothetical protein